MNFIKFIALLLAFFLYSNASFGNSYFAKPDNIQEEKELIEEGKLKGERSKDYKKLGFGGNDSPCYAATFASTPFVYVLHFAENHTNKYIQYGFPFTKQPFYILYSVLKIHCC